MSATSPWRDVLPWPLETPLIFFRSEDFLTTRALKLKRRRRGSGHGPAVMQRVWHSGSNPLLTVINPLLMLRYAALYWWCLLMNPAMPNHAKCHDRCRESLWPTQTAARINLRCNGGPCYKGTPWPGKLLSGSSDRGSGVRCQDDSARRVALSRW